MIRFLTFGFTVLMLVVSGMAYAGNSGTLVIESPKKLAFSSLLGGDGAAGISAYGQVSGGVDLELAKDAFRNIEKDRAEYIIGSVALPDYEETDDVHVYVDTEGWIVAYYCSAEQASKIIDWVGYHSGEEVSDTKLLDAMSIVASAMSVTLPEAIKYFDFRAPDATEMIIVVDKELVSGETETFNINVPTNHALYSSTWSHSIYNYDDSCNPYGTIKIDASVLHSVYSSGPVGWRIWAGDIDSEYISPGTFNEISLYHYSNGSTNDASYVGIMFIYDDGSS